jgi:DNA-binding GntR family transcriptional regulator
MCDWSKVNKITSLQFVPGRMNTLATKKYQVYECLKRSIITGEYKPGGILNEAELAQKLGFGKTPTREALILLAHEKLLEPMPRVGYVVTSLTIQEVLETFYLRIVLEVDAIGLAVVRITHPEIQVLEENNYQEEEVFLQTSEEQDRDQAQRLNRAFHLTIAKASGNQRLEYLVNDFLDDLERALFFDPSIADASQHRQIIEQLKNHDKVKAQEAMRTHLEETRNRILNRF